MRALGLARESVAGALETLPQGDWPGLGAALARGQQALEAVGVVTAAHRTIVAAALEAGAWGAKTTGAGYGGAVLLLGPPSLNVASLLAIPGVEGCFPAGGAP
jgi:mevalonate kinase